MAAGHERSNSRSFSLEAKRPVSRSPEWTARNTELTSWPAASLTVAGSVRSSFQYTPCPFGSASTRRPVTIVVWLGNVQVSSRTVRALRVDAPSFISRCNVGVRSGPASAIALDPTESSVTIRTFVVSGARLGRSAATVAGRASPAGVAVARVGARGSASTRDTRRAVRRTATTLRDLGRVGVPPGPLARSLGRCASR
jgi:hypothetical protein